MTGRGTSYEGKAPVRVRPEQGERRVALVVGNGHYAHAAPLDNPVRDAEAIAAVLTRLGFEVVKGLDLQLRSIGDVQATFEDKLRTKPDVALLFYAGHGLQVEGRNYLIPIDAEITQKAHLASRALLFNDVLSDMAEHAGASLIFLDACRDNPFTRNLARNLGDAARHSGVRGGLARIEKVAGTFIAYATAPDHVAFDGKGENSPFTSALLAHVETPGLSVGDLMIDVRNKVLAETNGRQEPWDQSSLRARFYFVPPEPDASRPTSEAASEWATIQGTTSLATLALFVERHKDSHWAEYAKVRAGELRLEDQRRQEEMARANAEDMARARVEAAKVAPDSLKPSPSKSAGLQVSELAESNGGLSEGALFEQAALEHWGSVKLTTDPAKLRAFLAEYETSRMGPLARAAMQRLATRTWRKLNRREAALVNFIETFAGTNEVAEAAAALVALRARPDRTAQQEVTPADLDRRAEFSIAWSFAIVSIPLLIILLIVLIGRMSGG